MHVLFSAYILTNGDAIGNDLLGMADILEDAGHTVRLFAEKAHVERDVHAIDELETALADDDTVLIHHHGARCDAAVRAIEQYPERSIVKFHNLTPSRYFERFHPELVRANELGLRQAQQLADLGVPFWTDSLFNTRERPTIPCDVLPPFHRADELRRLAPDRDHIGGQDDWSTTLLCVGRVAPNKNLELALETLARIRESLDPLARLVVVGDHVFPAYSQELLAYANALQVADGFKVTGKVSLAQLKSLYRAADVLLLTSHHEGFCVPLVEAMALQLPIVTVRRAAIPETAGPAALYAEDASGLSEHIRELAVRPTLRETVLHEANQRYRHCFQTPVLRQKFEREFARQLGEMMSNSKCVRMG